MDNADDELPDLEDVVDDDAALYLSCRPFLHAACALSCVILLLLAPEVVQAWQSGSLGQFRGELQALDVKVKQSKVDPGWTIAAYPHPLRNKSLCHNPAHPLKPNASDGSERDLYFCDPDGVLDVYEAARVTKRLLEFQENVRVSCALGADSYNSTSASPFFVGIALMHRIGLHYGEPEVDPANCASDQPCLQTEIDWFGDGLVHLWDLGLRRDKQYCPSAAVIVLVTEKQFFRLRMPSEYFVNRRGRQKIVGFMQEHFANNDWEGGLLAGIDAFQKYFEFVYFNKGYTPLYWWVMLGSAVPLALGLAAVVFGQSRNMSMHAAALERGDAGCGVCGCFCYLASALVSTVGLYMMTSFEAFWDPGSSDVSDLNTITLYAALLIFCGVPMFCPLSFGTILRNSRLNKFSIWSCLIPSEHYSAGPDPRSPGPSYSYRRVGP